MCGLQRSLAVAIENIMPRYLFAKVFICSFTFYVNFFAYRQGIHDAFNNIGIKDGDLDIRKGCKACINVNVHILTLTLKSKCQDGDFVTLLTK